MEERNDEIETTADGDTELSARERFAKTLKERADAIVSVRNDIFTTKWWQLALNFFMGGGALALLIVSTVMSGTVSTVCAIIGVVVVVALIVYNFAMKAVMPTSFLQYTCTDRGVKYCFQILSKTRTSFSDGKHVIEVDRGEAVMLAEQSYSQYKYDFFAEMQAEIRIEENGRETFKGNYTHNGKTYRCKIVFKNDTPLYGSVGGARIKYFDVNDTKDKFVVPAAIKRAVKGFKIDFPKIPGLYVKDDIKDATKQ